MNQRDNSGAMWKNEGKQAKSQERDTSKWPDYKGTATVNGKAFDVACWVVPAQDGKKARFDIKFNEPYQQQNNEPQQPQYDNSAFDDQDLPF